MARKSTRPAKTTDRYGTTRGNDEAVAANSTAATAGCLPKSTAAKRKGKKMKITYSSSSEASDTSMSSASSDNSLYPSSTLQDECFELYITFLP